MEQVTQVGGLTKGDHLAGVKLQQAMGKTKSTRDLLMLWSCLLCSTHLKQAAE